MRKVKIEGYVIFDEEELQHKTNIIGQIDHELFNVDGVYQWGFKEISNEESDYNWEDEEDED
ncbi:hypothetical protein ACDN41_12065 [Priestia aryabhattai]|uniref:hypothetical protein n=1 Tax=Priestia aryabhattai TaxID=412384 RepID=UPI0035318388